MGPEDSLYRYPLSPGTVALGEAAAWVFWGGMLAFTVYAIHLQRRGYGWLWAKLCFLPVYALSAAFLMYHTE